MSQEIVLNYLEKVILEKVSHWHVAGDVPPGIKDEVQDVEPEDEGESGELGLIANRHENHQHAAHHVLNDGDGIGLKAQEGDEHEDKEDAASQLQVLLGLVLSSGGHSWEEALALNAGLGQEEEEGAAEG